MEIKFESYLDNYILPRNRKIFQNLQVLRKKSNSIDDFVEKLKNDTKGRDSIIVSYRNRRESRNDNSYWDYEIKSDEIRLQGNNIWFSKKIYLPLNNLENWYIRIK